MSMLKGLDTDYFTQPEWPQDLVFDSPKHQPYQHQILNLQYESPIEILSSSLQILKTFQHTNLPQSQIQINTKTGKSTNSIKIKKIPKNSDKTKTQAQRQRKRQQNDKSLQKIKKSVRTVNNKVLYDQSKHCTEDLLTEEQKVNFQKIVIIKTFQEVQDELRINSKSKPSKPRPGKNPINEELQQKVIDYVKSLVEAKKNFTNSEIRKKALEFSPDPNFKASKGWYERFQVRNSDIFNYESKRGKQRS